MVDDALWTEETLLVNENSKHVYRRAERVQVKACLGYCRCLRTKHKVAVRPFCCMSEKTFGTKRQRDSWDRISSDMQQNLQARIPCL